jgi:hypothetical protein
MIGMDGENRRGGQGPPRAVVSKKKKSILLSPALYMKLILKFIKFLEVGSFYKKEYTIYEQTSVSLQFLFINISICEYVDEIHGRNFLTL